MNEFPPRMIVCVRSVVLRDNKVLFVRQTYGENLKNKWSIPWGFVQGDTPDSHNDPVHIAALREVHEEAGIIANIEGLLGIQNGIPSKEGYSRVYLLFLCKHVQGTPTGDNVETDLADYFTKEEIDQMEGETDPFCYWLAMRVLEGDHSLILPLPENPYSPNLAFL